MTVAQQRPLRLLVLAPLGRDASVIARVLEPLGQHTVVCSSLIDLVMQLDDNAAAAIVTEESLHDEGASDLRSWIDTQPPWSDFPFVVLATRHVGNRSAQASAALAELGNAVLLERPLNVDTLLSAIRSAIRSRLCQYQGRGQLEQQQAVGAENRRLYEAERQARAEAEAANRAKEDFLATLSHELRTPLSAILGWTYVLQKRRDELGDLVKGIEIIERNAKAQARLIEDLLDMSRIVADKVQLEYQTVVPAHLLEQLISSVQPIAQARDIAIEASLRDALIPINADAQRLQQVLWNLVTNAIKFTPAGGNIRVTAAVDGDCMRFEIADSGVGIAPEFLPLVFERFRQADGSTTRSHGGLGLGLAIVRRLVELHGGRVEAFSAGLGMGSTFKVYLPMAQDHANALPYPSEQVATLSRSQADLQNVRVLLVEDDDDGRQTIAQLIEDSGGEVCAVESAAAALSALKKNAFDVLISDIGMPDVDGFELLQSVRAEGNSIPAIALTAFARLEDKARALNVGYGLHLSKPLEPPILISAVADMARQSSATHGERAAKQDASDILAKIEARR